MKKFIFLTLLLFSFIVLQGCSQKDNSKVTDLPKINVESCDGISDNKELEKCHFNRAISLNEPDSCDKLNALEAKEGCYLFLASSQETVEEGLELCNKISVSEITSQYGKATCYQNVALKAKDEKICELIQNVEKESIKYDVTIVRQDCYFKLAVYTKNPELCKKTSGYYNLCLEEINR